MFEPEMMPVAKRTDSKATPVTEATDQAAMTIAEPT